MPSKIEAELLAATGLKRKKSETDQEYYHRLCTATAELEDTVWDKISDPAQDWHNKASKALDQDPVGEVQGFPDMADDESKGEEDDKSDSTESDEETEEAEEDTETKSEKRNNKVASKKKSGAKASAAKSSDKKPATKKKANNKPETKKAKTTTKVKTEKKGVSAHNLVKDMILRKPQAPADDLMESIASKGHKITRLTVTTIRSDFRGSARRVQNFIKTHGAQAFMKLDFGG